MNQPIDTFARDLSEGRRAATHKSSREVHEKRTNILFDRFEDPDRLRRLAGQIKQHVVEHLDTLLPAVEERMTANGVRVHWAEDAAQACEAVLSIMKARGARRIVKAKTMVSEEIGLEEHLKHHGIETLETDLGEFINQLDGDKPSHVIRPITHKSRADVARTFERSGLGDYSEDPETLALRARAFLREKYLAADVGITGANFVSVESGRVVVVTNEGNCRLCLAGTRCHIALVGIEKLVPRDRDLGLLLNLLARSATGQRLSVYTEFMAGPKAPGQPDGPEEMHVVFVDNGRTHALASDCREILRCIRCGACMNVCPVYRQASGHAYRSVYPGPMGAVLSPLLAGERFSDYADLPKASSLCGACNEVCPVDIPLPDLLLRLRSRGKAEGAPLASVGAPPMGGWSLLATQPTAWRAALAAGSALNVLPSWLIPVPALRSWTSKRTLPQWKGGAFRKWMKERNR
jgi:L-lactate dehydrogenase complex protein LldF